MKYASYVLLICLSVTSLSCKKYLDAKSNQSLEIPSSIADLQALLDDGTIMNGRGVSFDESSADNYYLTQTAYNGFSQENRNTYTWQNTTYSNYPNDWSYTYDPLNQANLVLDKIARIPVTAANRISWNNVKGSALFYRAYAYLQAAFIFCKAYDSATALLDYGLSLKLHSDLSASTSRANLRDTYQQVLTDLQTALPHLPDLPMHVLRPSRSAVYALLARTYLSMRIYDSCLTNANACLQLKSNLMDYNTVSATANRPFKRFNAEVIFQNSIGQPNYTGVSAAFALVDSALYSSYAPNDLRKTVFFKNSPPGYSFKGTYSSSSNELYIGLTTDEVYLMRAECYARAGDITDAMQDLNGLLITRWKKGTFIPFTAMTAGDALALVLTERRKQLLFRNLRWMDIKRLNKEGAGISLQRFINGQNYTLSPNENRFALPLPADIIFMTGIPQNPL